MFEESFSQNQQVLHEMQAALLHNQDRRDYLKSLLIKPYLTLKQQHSQLQIEHKRVKLQRSELQIEHLELKKAMSGARNTEEQLRGQVSTLKAQNEEWARKMQEKETVLQEVQNQLHREGQKCQR